jgi:tRNA threonylcarbamoyladenosine biosynthesis protein TsaB
VAAAGLTLALETSTRTPSAALVLHGVLLEERTSDAAAHASDLLPAVQRLLERAQRSPREIAAVIVGTGPGSYTGLRVGVATALGLARGSGARLRGVPSTDALAWGALAQGEHATVVIDARASELYCATYRRGGDELDVVRAPCITTRDELRGWLEPGARVFADDDAVRAAGLDERADLRIDRAARPLARHVLDLGLRRLATHGPQRPEEIEPLYLRAFAAKSKRR